ncbi:Radial spokehead-like protein [Carpediemonas membranifera]|uniref:Radial spokehead-like protein n=1 Tax=Carpediemonas membranifera TaxID=201153 RepID=A0A8J6BCR4_9EUKA|nr:Radial spokehead-like protein [Carpediemonas membranifera]|eukprot:KAG9394722.1 Radial spokehead-like protein [Carpediemonas membranifera]
MEPLQELVRLVVQLNVESKDDIMSLWNRINNPVEPEKTALVEEPEEPEKKPNEGEENEEEEEQEQPEEEEDPTEVPFDSIMDTLSMLSRHGVHLPETECHRIAVAIHKFVKSKPCSDLRFFGRLEATSNKPYYVLEAKPDDDEPEEEAEEEAAEEEAEPGESESTVPPGPPAKQVGPRTKGLPAADERGTGLNEFAYFVSTDLETWTRLPDLTPLMLCQSRYMAYRLSGDLGRKLPINKGEAGYMRCILARIAFSTVVHPKGMYMTDPEAEPDEPVAPELDEEWLGTEGIDSLDSWVHVRNMIYKNGKVSSFEEEEEEPEEPEEEEEDDEDDPFAAVKRQAAALACWEDPLTAAEEDVFAPRGKRPTALSPVTADGKGVWQMRKLGLVSAPRQVVMLKHTVWPGAMVVATNQAKTYACVYIGDGLKRQLLPLPPVPMLMTPVVDLHEQNDPTAEDEAEIRRKREAAEEQEAEED